MYYSLIGLLALLILIITNHDVLLPRMDPSAPEAQRSYRRFLLCIMAYYITDILWGVLDVVSLTRLLYVDTVVYYVAMASGIYSWAQYVVAYLANKGRFGAQLQSAGRVFFIAFVALLAVNLFWPILFWFDAEGRYHAGIMRHTMLVIQVLLFLLTSLYALSVARHSRGLVQNRHLTIGLFGLFMVVLLSIQLFYPLQPLYTIGYMLGGCVLRTFVIENEKDEYRKDLEAALRREKEQMQQLNSAWKLAYTDPLTGVKSKQAYAEQEEQIDMAIADGIADSVAVVVFDLNGLKHVNDTLGHEAGDRMIISACRLICEVFKHSPVFRVGGDEFVTILEGDDYRNRDALLEQFNQRVEENQKNNQVVVAAGMAKYFHGRDNSFERVFKRADRLMYRRKEELKQMERTE